MARSRKSHAGDEEKAKVSNSAKGGSPQLARAYSPMVGHNKYVLYVHRYNPELVVTGVLVWSFNEIYAVKWFLNTIIGPTGSYEERDDFGARRAVVTDLGVIISMFESQYDLYDILKHRNDLTDLQRAWSDELLIPAIMRVKYGREQQSTDIGDRQPDEAIGDSDAAGASGDTARTGRKGSVHKRGSLSRGTDAGDGDAFDALPKAARVGKARTPKPDGLVSAGDIGAELQEEPRIIRGVLRALKLEKPAHGWAWPKKEAEGIKAQIIAELKKGKKK